MWSLNGTRRQLSKSQLAVIAVKMLAPLKEEAKKRQEATGKHAPRDESGHFAPVPPVSVGPARPTGEAVAEAAKLVGVGKTQVQDAKAIVEQAPDLVPEIQSGRMSVDYTRQRNA